NFMFHDIVERPDAIDALGAVRRERHPAAIRKVPIYIGIRHDIRPKIIGSNEPGVTISPVLKWEIFLNFPAAYEGLLRIMPLHDQSLLFRAVRSPLFVQVEQRNSQQQTNHNIRDADAPKTDACSAHGGEFVMSRVIREGIEERAEQG